METIGRREFQSEQGWTWHDLEVISWSEHDFAPLEERYPEIKDWLRKIQEIETNYLSVRFPDGIQPVLFGSMLYSLDEKIEDGNNFVFMHFFVSTEVLITINLDSQTRNVMNTKEKLVMLASCEKPIDGMFVLARTLLHYFHVGMDRFERNLRKVEEVMRKRNQKNLMDQILDARFELLYWSNLFIPFQELITAAKEAYLDELCDSKHYMRFLHRAERMNGLFEHYEKEIDTLISIDDAVAGFRGNDIMKTLTIITVLFTPAMVIGAVWGMNFDFLPWVKDGVTGFILITAVIIASTLGFYAWIRMKGWTKDLLEGEDEEKVSTHS